MGLNRAERRLAASINTRQTRLLGRAVQHRDAAMAGVLRLEAWVAADLAAGRSIAWAEPRLSDFRARLAEAEIGIDAAREEIAMREASVEAASLSHVIDAHLAEIGLDALPY